MDTYLEEAEDTGGACPTSSGSEAFCRRSVEICKGARLRAHTPRSGLGAPVVATTVEDQRGSESSNYGWSSQGRWKEDSGKLREAFGPYTASFNLSELALTRCRVWILRVVAGITFFIRLSVHLFGSSSPTITTAETGNISKG